VKAKYKTNNGSIQKEINKIDVRIFFFIDLMHHNVPAKIRKIGLVG